MQQAYLQVGYDCKDYRFSLAARRFTDEEMLHRLKRLLQERGHLSERIIERAEGLPSGLLYRRRFGSLYKAYQLIGYMPPSSKHPNRPRRLSKEAMLDALRRLLKERGRLSQAIIDACDYVPSADAYSRRFGSLMQAYRLIGLVGDRYAMTHPRPRGLSKEEMLDSLRKLLREHGRLSLCLIEKSKQTPSPYQYQVRFGSMMRAYELIGYHPRHCGHVATKARNTKRRRPVRGGSPA
jgi:hypothetical protein